MGGKSHFCYGGESEQEKAGDGFNLLVQKCRDDAFEDIISGQVWKLKKLKKVHFLPDGNAAFPINELPVLFWGEPSSGKFAAIEGHRLVIHADILAATFFMLSRYEEIDSPHLDKHGRYPFTASVCSRCDLIDLPIVDYYTLVLKAWLEKLTGVKFDIPHKFHFHFSHDVDYMLLSHPFTKWVDVIARDVVKARWDFLQQDFPSLFKGFREDRYFKDLKRLVETARENGNQDIFYLLTSKPLFSRDGYSLKSKPTKVALDYLQNNAARIGLHASYASFDRPELYSVEKERLEKACGIPISDARQHYLRVARLITGIHEVPGCVARLQVFEQEASAAEPASNTACSMCCRIASWIFTSGP